MTTLLGVHVWFFCYRFAEVAISLIIKSETGVVGDGPEVAIVFC